MYMRSSDHDCVHAVNESLAVSTMHIGHWKVVSSHTGLSNMRFNKIYKAVPGVKP